MPTLRSFVAVLIVVGSFSLASAQDDPVLFWNNVMQKVIQDDGATAYVQPTMEGPNPGWSTRTIAMTNGAIYDIFQAFDRKYAPFMVNTTAPAGASMEAAIAQASYDILADCYDEMMLGGYTDLGDKLDERLALVPAGPGKDAGVALGHAVAAAYMDNRTADGSQTIIAWPEGDDPGEWGSDPLHAPQSAWGPAWGTVNQFVPTPPNEYSVGGPPSLNSTDYQEAYDQVKDYGALVSPSRDDDQTDIGLFWAYDRKQMGPPPVLFLRNAVEIAEEVGTSPDQNARMFAMMSVAMADAATAAWNIKFDDNFWRPVTAIRAGDADTNDNTDGDANWVPLGAPGGDPNDPNDPENEDDFTPPFPAYTSGHATMGGAVFKALENFFGTNSFQEADEWFGSDPAVDAMYSLTSSEWDHNGDAGMTRSYRWFTQEYGIDDNGDLIVDDIFDMVNGPGQENSPEGENAMSRIYLGVHWIFDQEHGTLLGNEVADYVFNNRFQAVPEPSSIALAAIGLGGIARLIRRRRR